MTKQQEFRKQTEEAKFEAFSLMCKKVADLENENAELKALIKSEHEIEARKNNRLISEITKAKEIIKSLIALHYNPVVTKDDLKKQDKILEQTEQFLKEIEK